MNNKELLEAINNERLREQASQCADHQQYVEDCHEEMTISLSKRNMSKSLSYKLLVSILTIVLLPITVPYILISNHNNIWSDILED